MGEISRALARHDVTTVYTLLREHLEPGVAGRALQALVRTVPDWDPQIDAEPNRTLTGREIEVLRCAAEGLSARATAQRLYLSPLTVSEYHKHIHAKLHVTTTTGAIAAARDQGLIP